MHTLVKVVSYQKKAVHTHLSKGCMSVSYNNKKAINTHLTEGCIVPKKSILHTISLRQWWRKPHIPISILYSNLTSPLTPSLPQPAKFWGWNTHIHTPTHTHTCLQTVCFPIQHINLLSRLCIFGGKASGFQICHFYCSFSSQITVVKGLTLFTTSWKQCALAGVWRIHNLHNWLITATVHCSDAI